MWVKRYNHDLLWWCVQKANQANIPTVVITALQRRNADRLDLDGVIYRPGEALLNKVDWTCDERGVFTVNFRLESLVPGMGRWQDVCPLEPMAVLLREC